MSDELQELLKPFRNDPSTNDAAAALVLGDDEAVRVLAAFRNVEHKWRLSKKTPPPTGASLIKRWLWLTDNWRIDIEGIAEAAALSEDVAESKVDMLLANRLIYPDGTIAYGAIIALQMHTQVKLGIKPKAKKQEQAAPVVAKPEPKKEPSNG